MKIPKALMVALVSLLAAPCAFAQATGTWVSGVGDDVNPCSRTAPCKTFAGAYSKTAAGGEIRVLDPGGYGAVTIGKSITINGDGTLATILASGVNGIIVNTGPNDVVIIRNISINGAGSSVSASGLNGIRFIGAGELHVENVKIYGFTQQGIDFNNNGVSQLFVTDTTIKNATGGGILLHPTGVSAPMHGALNRVTLEGNGRGLRAEDLATVAIRDSAAMGNDANGFVAYGTTYNVDMTLENVVSSNNGAAGVYSGPHASVKLSNVTSTRNADGLITTGGGVSVSFSNNRIYDNGGNNGPASSVVGQQ